MNTRFTIDEHGDVLTVHLLSSAMGNTIKASLHGRYLYSLVDGLLWWAINRKLDSLVATSMGTNPPAHRDDALEWGMALSTGEELVMNVFTTPFYEASEERQQRIVKAISRHLPKLEALTRNVPHAAIARAELAELTELCTLLHDRIQHPAEAMRGLDGMVTQRKAA